MSLTFEEYKKKIEGLNGAHIIVINQKGEILNFKSKYGEKKRMLPGGKLERNELPQHAVQSESEEETGLYPENQSLQLIGVFMQRVPGITEIRGFSILFFSDKTMGKLIESDEGEFPEYWPPEKIISERDKFIVSTPRLVAYYLKWVEDKKVRCTRLAEPLPFLFEGKLIEI